MPSKKQPTGRLGRTRAKGLAGPGYLDDLLNNNPILKAALAAAKDRFGKTPGVRGFGIGRRFHEKAGKYAPRKDLCIKILVARKLKHTKAAARIPRWISIRLPGKSQALRVELDVISLLADSNQPGRLSETVRGWPTAGRIDVGSLFATKPLPPGASIASLQTGAAEVGTTGALVSIAGSSAVYAVTASHVFLDLCAGDRNSPTDDRAVAVTQTQWGLVPNQSYYPLTVNVADAVRDALAFRVPDNFRSAAPRWPDGFTGELATTDDINRAILSETANGFIWVERTGAARPIMIPIDLETMLDPVVLDVAWNGQTVAITFVQTWRSRFLPGSQTTMGGDSGSGVFLWAENNTNCRLLGFHFYEPDDLSKSYAADARWFLRQAFGKGLGTSYNFLV